MPPLGFERFRPATPEVTQADLSKRQQIAELQRDVKSRAFGSLLDVNRAVGRKTRSSARASYDLEYAGAKPDDPPETKTIRAWTVLDHDHGTELVQLHTDMVEEDPNNPGKYTAIADGGRSLKFVIGPHGARLHPDYSLEEHGCTLDEQLSVLADIGETLGYIEAENVNQRKREA